MTQTKIKKFIYDENTNTLNPELELLAQYQVK